MAFQLQKGQLSAGGDRIESELGCATNGFRDQRAGLFAATGGDAHIPKLQQTQKQPLLVASESVHGPSEKARCRGDISESERASPCGGKPSARPPRELQILLPEGA
ncbi:hypothetical protein BH18ACT14_BH18ACT14_09880 [soil metagenome]